MNKMRLVALMDNLRKRNCSFRNNVAVLATAAGNHQVRRLHPTFRNMEYNILLQHAIISECGFARLKYVEPANFQVGQKVLAKRTKIRTITETPRRNSNKLTARSQQALNDGDESGVKIACFDASITEVATFRRVHTDFTIRRIHDDRIKNRRFYAKQVIGKATRHLFNKVSRVYRERKPNARIIANALTIFHVLRESILNERVKLIKSRLNGTNAVPFPANTLNKCESQRSSPGPGIEKPNDTGDRAKQGSHKISQRRGRQKLAEFASPSTVC